MYREVSFNIRRRILLSTARRAAILADVSPPEFLFQCQYTRILLQWSVDLLTLWDWQVRTPRALAFQLKEKKRKKKVRRERREINQGGDLTRNVTQAEFHPRLLQSTRLPYTRAGTLV